MFLPIGDSPNPERFTPYMTWGIIAANIAVFLFINVPLSSQPVDPSNPMLEEYVRMLLEHGIPITHIQAILAQTSLNDLLLYQYGFKPAAPTATSLFASIFLHGSLLHLLGNMLFLHIYGDNTEHQLGRIRFLLTYLATGVIATLSFAVFAGDSHTPLVGASGAISGVLGYYFLVFPKNRVKVLILLFPIFMNVIRIPARIVLGIYVLIDNLLPLLAQAGGNVAHGAHLGGFFAGLAVAAIGQSRWKGSWPRLFRSTGQSPGRKSGSRPLQAASFREKIELAVDSADTRQLLSIVKNGGRKDFRSLEMETILKGSRILKHAGFLEQANSLLKRGLSVQRNSPLLPDVYYELGKIRLQQGFSTAAYQHLLTALELHPSPETETRIRQELKKIRL